MNSQWSFFLLFAATTAWAAQSAGKGSMTHPVDPRGPAHGELDQITAKVSAKLPYHGPPSGRPIPRNNYIDDFVFAKMERASVPHAPLSSDEEFLRRLYLDLTGRIPEVDRIKSFLKDPDPNKRNRLIDELTNTYIDPKFGGGHPTSPYLDRWTHFFCDLFRNAAAELGAGGRNQFWDYINTSLLLNVPYNQIVTEMLTATARSSWQAGPANFLARNHADDADGLAINHEDTIEDIAISATRDFLGINLECIACHDGARHLEKINSWLSRRKRDELWRHASFFGGLRIYRGFGTGQEFTVREDTHRFDLKYPSVKRVQRYQSETAPAFLLTGETPRPGENPRVAFARMLTSHPQFARATVNLIWAEMMGVGIIDPPLEFDLDRQYPQNPPPAPWTIQPTHPELLDALAKDFVEHNYNLKHVIKLIATSSAYQLSCQFYGEWKPVYASYFARHFVRRLAAEQLYDAISQATGVFVEIPIGGISQKMKYAMQARCPSDFSGKELDEARRFLASFGQSNRDQGEKSLGGAMVQASMLLNSKLIKDRLQPDKGRLGMLLKADPPKSNEAIVEELFLASLGRFPTAGEKRIGISQIERYREVGVEDLLWSLLNKTEFIFNH